MSEELQDEVTSINSIYGDNTFGPTDTAAIYTLALPSQPAISLRLEFPSNYPDAPPSILGTHSTGSEIAKGEGQQLVELVRAVLAEIYTPAAPCVFDLIEAADERLQHLGLDAATRRAEQQAAEADSGAHASSGVNSSADLADGTEQSSDALGEAPAWILSDVVSEKKSVFVARAAAVDSVDQAKLNLAHLLATDKKVAKATHNITAWRVRRGDGIQFQDCDDDGETAAGGRVLHLLELMNVWNVMVVVTRWYGGVQLGPDRFRIINQTARDAVVKGGFGDDGGAKEAAGKKKGKK